MIDLTNYLTFEQIISLAFLFGILFYFEIGSFLSKNNLIK